ncbi:hypothetical protein OSB04_026259 [Centaurea solstitialis]|uniref:Aquaporin TIP5-1 n=1 Tax=Centaurea solstitialis TaxID=347529 RepID=A0AA38SWM9_9ASTR|nr:hypothetical protein OSB04_026259 [Centaurea solstitialis]
MASLKDRFKHAITLAALRSYLAEFLSTFFFVFAAVGSAMSSRKMSTPEAAISDPSSLVETAIVTAFALSVAVYLAVNVSGGHVNPAVTFTMAVGGHISIPMTTFYWISQMLESLIACMVLKSSTLDTSMVGNILRGAVDGIPVYLGSIRRGTGGDTPVHGSTFGPGMGEAMGR